MGQTHIVSFRACNQAKANEANQTLEQCNRHFYNELNFLNKLTSNLSFINKQHIFHELPEEVELDYR